MITDYRLSEVLCVNVIDYYSNLTQQDKQNLMCCLTNFSDQY